MRPSFRSATTQGRSLDLTSFAAGRTHSHKSETRRRGRPSHFPHLSRRHSPGRRCVRPASVPTDSHSPQRHRGTVRGSSRVGSLEPLAVWKRSACTHRPSPAEQEPRPLVPESASPCYPHRTAGSNPLHGHLSTLIPRAKQSTGPGDGTEVELRRGHPRPLDERQRASRRMISSSTRTRTRSSSSSTRSVNVAPEGTSGTNRAS